MPSLSPTAMRRLVQTARVARLATVDAAGRPHLVPVCFVLIGGEGGASGPSDDHGGRVHIAVDHKPKRSTELRRTANLRATGQACLLIDHYDEDWSQLWWVRLDGHGAQVDDPGEVSRALDALAAKYPQYREHRPDGPVLTIEIQAWRGWAATARASLFDE
ncbi:MAG TPA: TIGR03668 family PPOX class F420-dependent oxidoreductase [Jatrophihabitans sp.]|jgi:PPOX class probable F420-dependent enzyme|uniref:TIGR03668 family PPOX class F420-dependent oxidoreductase n=1 Tax=Jatrophihabitans sp. TaxID=1932789 RepID=UPI002EE780F1